MKTSNLNRSILRLAIPSILANITTPLLGLVDTAIVGHMGSALFIAAIGVGSVMFNMMYWLFDFLRAGTSGLSAQAYGARDVKESTLVLSRAVSLACGIGLAMIALQWPLCNLLLTFLDAGQAASDASVYFYILIYGAPAALANYALSGWYLGIQRAKMLLWISLVINVTNILTSLLLVYAFEMGIRGVAFGSLTAQWSGCIFGLFFLRKQKLVKVGWGEIFRISELRGFFKVNFDVMVRTACIIAVTVWFTRSGGSQGALVLAANTLLMQFFYTFSYIMDGFAFAGEALVGEYFGAGLHAKLRRCVRILLWWGVAMAAIFSMAFFLGGETLISWLSDNADVRDVSARYYVWAAGVPIAGFAAFVWDGVYIGAMQTRRMLWCTFGAMIAFFISYFLLFPSMANHGLWLAFLIYLAARGILQAIFFTEERRRGE